MVYRDNLTDYLPDFCEALQKQLEDDQLRWGDTWKHRPLEGQTERFRVTFDEYFDQERYGGEPVDWLKVAGNALIAWVREQETHRTP